MPRHELAWVAGLIEGEGCIRCTGKDGRSYPHVKVAMTDEDVIRRCYEITGIGILSGPHHYGTRPQNKPVYTWAVGRKDECLTLLGGIWPYLGERRKAQTTATLLKWRERPVPAHLLPRMVDNDGFVINRSPD